MKPDNGLFKPKHVAYFTLYCELCTTAWEKDVSVNKILILHFLVQVGIFRVIIIV